MPFGQQTHRQFENIGTEGKHQDDMQTSLLVILPLVLGRVVLQVTFFNFPPNSNLREIELAPCIL